MTEPLVTVMAAPPSESVTVMALRDFSKTVKNRSGLVNNRSFWTSTHRLWSETLPTAGASQTGQGILLVGPTLTKQM